MRIMRKTSRGYICMDRGTEGPTYDPYSFVEWTCAKGEVSVTLHMGLGLWLRFESNNRRTYRAIAASDVDDLALVDLFEMFVGIELPALEKALHRRPRMSAKDRRWLEEIEAADNQLLRYAM